MRTRFLLTVVSLACSALVAGEPPAPSPTPAPIPPPAPSETAVPLKIPGYELRVLDVQKDVTINVGGTWTRASLPVFIYVPTSTAERTRALELLRKTYADLLALAKAREWSAADLQRVLAGIDAAITALEKTP